MIRRSVASLLSVLSVAACGGQMMYKTSMKEFVNPNLSPSKYNVIAVLPVEASDMQVAGRARMKLKEANVRYVPAVKMVPEGDVGMEEVCPKTSAPEYKGVLFVSWDRIILRDCETHAVAYRILGNYAGIDRMIEKFASYLKTKPASS